MLSKAFFRSQKIPRVLFFILNASEISVIKEYEASVVEDWDIKPTAH
jgi:hypothetical protein